MDVYQMELELEDQSLDTLLNYYYYTSTTSSSNSSSTIQHHDQQGSLVLAEMITQALLCHNHSSI